jgi:hypothetical protein
MSANHSNEKRAKLSKSELRLISKILKSDIEVVLDRMGYPIREQPSYEALYCE